MSDQLWIEPAGGPEQWRRFNRYRDGRPVKYINNHVDLLSNDDYMRLPVATALLLHRLWLAFALTRAHLWLGASGVRGRLQFVRSVTGMDVQARQLDLLVEAGFIRISVTRPSRKRYGFVTKSDGASARDARAEVEELQVLKPAVRDVGVGTDVDGPPPFDDEQADDISFAIPDNVLKPMP